MTRRPAKLRGVPDPTGDLLADLAAEVERETLKDGRPRLISSYPRSDDARNRVVLSRVLKGKTVRLNWGEEAVTAFLPSTMTEALPAGAVFAIEQAHELRCPMNVGAPAGFCACRSTVRLRVVVGPRAKA